MQKGHGIFEKYKGRDTMILYPGQKSTKGRVVLSEETARSYATKYVLGDIAKQGNDPYLGKYTQIYVSRPQKPKAAPKKITKRTIQAKPKGLLMADAPQKRKSFKRKNPKKPSTPKASHGFW